MLNENRLYSISLGVASLQDGLVGVATALSPAMAGHFKFLLHHFFVRLGLIALTGTSDAQFSHPRLQSRALHAESSGGTRGPADHPIGFAESAHDVLPLGMLQSEDAVERRNRDYFRSLL